MNNKLNINKHIIDFINEKENILSSQDKELMFYFSQIKDIAIRKKIINLVENFAIDYQKQEEFFKK